MRHLRHGSVLSVYVAVEGYCLTYLYSRACRAMYEAQISCASWSWRGVCGESQQGQRLVPH